jgi:hypothetical protein
MEQMNIHTAKTRISSRIGFMKGRASVPDDFDDMFLEEIKEMFSGSASEVKYEDDARRYGCRKG